MEAGRLESALRRHLRGEVRFDTSSRALYATDGSNYRQVPIGVVFPRDEADVVAAISLARENRIPILVFSIFESGGFAEVLRARGRYTIIGEPN